MDLMFNAINTKHISFVFAGRVRRFVGYTETSSWKRKLFSDLNIFMFPSSTFCGVHRTQVPDFDPATEGLDSDTESSDEEYDEDAEEVGL